MRFKARLTNLGAELSLDDGDGSRLLKPADDANQENPRRSYVYAHTDSVGEMFYVGKGEGKRAWSTDRHPLWHRYVEKHLGGNYKVRILQDDLSPTEAETVEAAWITQYSDGLVNWVNMGRATDFQALERYHKLRDANRALVQRARAVEKYDQGEAVKMYVQSVEAIPEYAFIRYEKGLVGRLIAEEAEEIGERGEIEAIDRLTGCLVKLGRPSEAAQYAKDYFATYRRDRQLTAAQRISKRIANAIARAR